MNLEDTELFNKCYGRLLRYGEQAGTAMDEFEEFLAAHGEKSTKKILLEAMISSPEGLPVWEEIWDESYDPDFEIQNRYRQLMSDVSSAYWHENIDRIPIPIILRLFGYSIGTEVSSNILELMKLHPEANPDYLTSQRMASPSMFGQKTAVSSPPVASIPMKLPLYVHVMKFARFVLDSRPEWYPEGAEYITPDNRYGNSDARWVLIAPFEDFYKETAGEVYTNMDHEVEELFYDLFYTGPPGMSAGEAINAKKPVFYATYDQLFDAVNL